MPGDGDINSYRVHLQKLPLSDRPEIFGLHEVATQLRQTSEGKKLLEKVFQFEFASKELAGIAGGIDDSHD